MPLLASPCNRAVLLKAAEQVVRQAVARAIATEALALLRAIVDEVIRAIALVVAEAAIVWAGGRTFAGRAQPVPAKAIFRALVRDFQALAQAIVVAKPAIGRTAGRALARLAAAVATEAILRASKRRLSGLADAI